MEGDDSLASIPHLEDLLNFGAESLSNGTKGRDHTFLHVIFKHRKSSKMRLFYLASLLSFIVL